MYCLCLFIHICNLNKPFNALSQPSFHFRQLLYVLKSIFVQSLFLNLPNFSTQIEIKLTGRLFTQYKIGFLHLEFIVKRIKCTLSGRLVSIQAKYIFCIVKANWKRITQKDNLCACKHFEKKIINLFVQHKLFLAKYSFALIILFMSFLVTSISVRIIIFFSIGGKKGFECLREKTTLQQKKNAS